MNNARLILVALMLAAVPAVAGTGDAATRCQLCGMDAAKSDTEFILYPATGPDVHACSVVCARRLMQRPGVDITRAVTRDYRTRQYVPAREAAYVRDSKRVPKGSMPPFVFAFGSAEDAQAFMKANGGQTSTYDELMKPGADDQEALAAAAAKAAAPVAAAAPEEFKPLAKPGSKIPLDADHYFVYGFDKPPKLAVCIMRVEIFSKDGKVDRSFVVKGDADMPSMRGAHSTGERDFSISGKGVYLLPVRLVMPGDWEVRFRFEKEGVTVLRGAYLFDL